MDAPTHAGPAGPSDAGRRRLLRATGALAALAALPGCGFRLRGAATFPFETIAIPGVSPFVTELRRNIAAGSNAKVVEKPDEAQAIFVSMGELRDKVILSISTQGRVREYQLRYGVSFRVHDGKGGEYIPTSQVILRRDISFNDQVLAKESEELLLYRDMQSDMVQQIIRRMQAAKLQPAD